VVETDVEIRFKNAFDFNPNWRLETKKKQKMHHAMQTNTQMPSSSPPFIATGQHPKPITDNKL